MPKKTVLPMEQRQRFVALAMSDQFTISELCEQFGISRKTGHKWIGRYAQFGSAGLAERRNSFALDRAMRK